MSCMRVITARVVAGKIDVGDAQLREGTSVAVLVPEDSGFALSDEDQEELEAALAEIHAGKYTDGRQLLRELKEQAAR